MVSIVVTHKKGLAYLRDCLDSIAEQKFKDYETILVIDNCQEDLTDIISEYQAKTNMRVYYLDKVDFGVSAARNLGLDKAGGDFVYFLDSDDYLYEDAIGNLRKTIRDEDDLAYGNIAYTWFQKKAFNPENKNDDEINFFEDDKQEEYNPYDIFDFRYRKFKKLETITVLGVLYRKSFLVDNHIRFDEDQLYYADAPFFTKVMSCVGGYSYAKDTLYVKRYHNDKEENPSVNQIEDDNREDYYIKSYRECKKYISSLGMNQHASDGKNENKHESGRQSDNRHVCNKQSNNRHACNKQSGSFYGNCDGEFSTETKMLKSHLELILCKYFVRYYAPRFHWDKNVKWDKEKLVPFQTEIAQINKKSIKSMRLFHRILINKVIKNNLNGMKRWTNIVLIKKKLVKMFGSKQQLYKAINLHVFCKMSMKENWVTFESFVGRNYSGQPKYIYQYMQKELGDQYKYIWIVDKKDIKIDGKHIEVKRFGLRYFYYMTRSKYWINNMRQPSWLPRRKNQIMLETWHGTPLKRLVFDMEDVHAVNPHYKNIVYKQSRGWDYLLSDNPFSTEKFQSCFRFDKEKILEVGYPANDPLYAPDIEEKTAKIKDKLGIPLDKKVILYAPTWRDDNYYDAGEYKFELALDLERLKKEISKEYVVLLRMHYWIVDKLNLAEYKDFVFNVSSYDDITELYMISDICMTDYSSVFFDYANLKRPILFYTYDLDKYRDVLRGFYLDVEKDLPGPLLLTNDEVVDAIRNIEDIQKKYQKKYEEFYNRFCCIDDGNAAKRVVEAVFKK